VSDTFDPPVPLPDPDTQAWWDSLKSGIFAIERCEACGVFEHPPLEVCRFCGGPLVLREVLGTGTLHSFIIQRRAMLPGFEVPYVVGMIELDDQVGLRVTGRVTGDVEAAAIGMRVAARIEPIAGSEFSAPVFDPID
jgi:uncharacterized OB-fold protein